jgi:pimeloyl-ACP methyl ester carboxylesterase
MSARLPGYDAALASSLRHGPVRGLAPSFAALGRMPHLPALLLWGTADDAAPYRLAARVHALVPHAVRVDVQGAPHDLTLSHPGVVSEALVKFFGEGGGKAVKE